MSHPLIYDDFLTMLATDGFGVVGVHPVSHGKSPRELKTYTVEDMVQNTSDAITFALSEMGDQVILMGSSQGGILTLAAAAKDHRIKAAFPHNVLVPSLADSIRVTRFPDFLKPLSGLTKRGMAIGAKLAPRLPIPISFYLNLDRVSKSHEVLDWIMSDPLQLTTYPLHFLSSLFNYDLTDAMAGNIECPVVMLTAKGDPLFPFDYCMQVYEMIRAPHKEVLLFDEPYHLIFQECVDRVAGPILAKLREYA
jgi:pimeloyl-ACP methyl ester carboxylesterase